MPNTIISDNAKTFKAAASHLTRELSDRTPKWQFITPRAPWCGGFWERMIKTIKISLKKTLGLRCQTRYELETTLQQIEACVNSRPLTRVYDECSDLETLTPSHFLLGRSDGHRPVGELEIPYSEITENCLRDLFKTRNQHLDRFWQIWQRDYIRNLPLIKHTGVNKDLLKGSVCLIKEDNISRTYWPMGIIKEIFPGKDDVVRSVLVKTAKGEVIRPVNRICSLEILNNDSSPIDLATDPGVSGIDSDIPFNVKANVQLDKFDNDMNLDVNDKLYVTRTGRLVKRNKRFD